MSVAKTYARALFETATGAKSSSQDIQNLEDELGALVAAIEGSKEGRRALMSPLVGSKEKGALVDAITKKVKISPLNARFLSLLARKGRFSLLSEIHKSFALVRVEAEGGITGTVVAADVIDGADVEKLAKAFGKKLNKRVAFNVSTEPSLLAGMKVTVNGVTYDGTLRSQLQKLRDQINVAVPG